MKFGKRLAALGISAAVAVSALPFSVFADEDEQVITAYRFETSYGTAYYSDSYFDEPGTVENEHLRTISMIIAGSTNEFASDPEKSQAYAILKNSGFDTDYYEAEGTDIDYDPNGIGTVIGSKCLDDGESEDDHQDLVVVSVRGLGYGAEWGSNLTVGTEGDAKGFKDSADIVINRLLAYEAENELKGAKIWLIGYSRGAGVADQVGKYINQHLDEFGIDEGGLYGYNFATPRSSTEKTEYKNIHDFVDVNDPVPMLMPEVWGSYHTGVVTYFDCGDNLLPRMTLALGSDRLIKPKTVMVDDPDTGGKKEVPDEPFYTSNFNNNLVNTLGSSITREEFAALEPVFQTLIPLFLGSKADPNLLPFLQATAKGMKLDLSNPLLPWVMMTVGYQKGSEEYDAQFAALPGILEQLVQAAGTQDMISAEYRTAIEEDIAKLAYHLLPVAFVDLTSGTDFIATLIGQAGTIIKHHYPDHYINNVKSLDSYYTRKTTVKNGSVFYLTDDIEISDLDQLRADGTSESDLAKLIDGYNIYYYTDGIAPDTDITEEQSAAIEDALEDYEKPVVAAVFIPKYYKEVEFEDPEEIDTDETKKLYGWIHKDDMPEFFENDDPVYLVKINGTDVTLMQCEYGLYEDDPDWFYFLSEYDFSDKEAIYAAVKIAVEKTPEPEPEPEPTPEKPEDKGGNPDTGYAFAGGILMISAVGMLIASRKRSK
ncbi:MAG: hypothetical protein IKP95_08750 [Ruminococcus sp.]|nr:hypothetical protein [Ruminococcus sp.]